jgi:mersacidin/lichenicidin family type 2 lantibiotic
MHIKNIIRTWKDEEYRLSLSDVERAMLPPHPAGLIDLADAELDSVAGGAIVQGTGTICQKQSCIGCTPYCPTHVYDPCCGLG